VALDKENRGKDSCDRAQYRQQECGDSTSTDHLIQEIIQRAKLHGPNSTAGRGAGLQTASTSSRCGLEKHCLLSTHTITSIALEGSDIQIVF
jgi:hypothetical protein